MILILALIILCICQHGKIKYYKELYFKTFQANKRLVALNESLTKGNELNDEEVPEEVTVTTTVNEEEPSASVEQPPFEPDVQPQMVTAAVSKVEPASKEKEQVSSINILFTVGVFFIIVAGLIFATTTWEFLSNGIRAVVIFLFTAAFFMASVLAEKRYKLEKTGMVFYLLGSIFLPITLIAAGYFEMFGEWFSLNGEGHSLLTAVTFLTLSFTSLIGSVKYNFLFFTWCGLLSFSAFIGFLIIQFTDDIGLLTLIASIYSFAMILACNHLSKKESKVFGSIIAHLNDFAAVNMILLRWLVWHFWRGMMILS